MKLESTILVLLTSPQRVYGNTMILRLRQTKSACKFMMIIFFDHKCVKYQHAISPKNNLNGEDYVSVLKILQQHISRKRHQLVGNWTLHQNNARLQVTTCRFSNKLVNVIIVWIRSKKKTCWSQILSRNKDSLEIFC